MASRHYNRLMATDKPSYPSDAADKFIVRFPPGMRERIADAARLNNRSMNAEVVARIAATFEMDDNHLYPVEGDGIVKRLVEDNGFRDMMVEAMHSYLDDPEHRAAFVAQMIQSGYKPKPKP